MKRDKRSRSVAAETLRSFWAVALLAALAAASATRIEAQPCLGDCDGDGGIELAELVTGIRIALGLADVLTCSPLDDGGDRAVGIDELLGAVGVSMNGCGGPVDVGGFCRRPASPGEQPGANGLVGCAGDRVTLSRCDDRRTCLADGGLVILDFGTIAAGGSFSATIDRARVADRTLLFDVALADGSHYRTLSFGLIASAGGGAGGVTDRIQVLLEPSTEAAVRLIDEQGLETFSSDGALEVIRASTTANLATDYNARSPAEASNLATVTARGDAQVQEALEEGKLSEVVFRFSALGAAPGGSGSFDVSLDSGAVSVAGTENVVGFPANVVVAADTQGRPRCGVNPTIGKPDSSFEFQPPGCSGVLCRAVKAYVLSFANLDPIPDGSRLYTCELSVAPNSPSGTFPLTCSASRYATPPPVELPAPPAICGGGDVRVE